MKIAIDAMRATVPHWGGIENYSYYLIQALSKVNSSHELTLLTNTPVHSRALPAGPNVKIKILWPPRLWTQTALSRETFISRFDVLLLPGQNLPLVFNWRLPTVVVFHDLSPVLFPAQYRWPGILYLKLFSWLSAKLATHLIAVSEATKKDLISVYGVKEGKITVVPEAIDRDVFRPILLSESQPVLEKYELNKPFIIFVGTVQPRKNIVRLIEAFAEVKKEYGSPLELLIVGKTGWKNEDIYYAPSRLHISDSVRFLGHVDDSELPALISRAELMAYPSLFEGFGLVILEAMACGVPVVTSNISSMPEVAGEAALLVDPLNTRGIADGLLRVLKDASLASRLVELGHKRMADFSWEKTARETLKVLERVGRNVGKDVKKR